MKAKVLFVCVKNSARSQMAEEFLRKYGGDKFEVESAGFDPGSINPVVAGLLKDEGIDISGKKTKSVFELFKEGRLFQYVVTVCDESQAEGCPIFPGLVIRRHWSFPDPAGFTGSPDEIKSRTREVMEDIREAVKDFIANEDYLREKFKEAGNERR